jgi:hypothetical protein
VIAKGRGRESWLPEGTVAEVVRVTLEETPDDTTTHCGLCLRGPVTSALRLQRRIIVNVIAPGAIATDSAAGWFATTPR